MIYTHYLVHVPREPETENRQPPFVQSTLSHVTRVIQSKPSSQNCQLHLFDLTVSITTLDLFKLSTIPTKQNIQLVYKWTLREYSNFPSNFQMDFNFVSSVCIEFITPFKIEESV